MFEHKRYPSVEFAYAFVKDGRPQLFRVADRTIYETTITHLGDHQAFGKFQALRHDTDVDTAPNARHAFMIGSGLPEPPPDDLRTAVVALMRLFASTSERAVGGWPTPFQLTKHGARLCSFAYSVTDPIVDQLKPGEIIPHGTATAGGFAFSLTELPDRRGMVAYWLQKPGGVIMERSDKWYKATHIDDTPQDFCERATAILKQPIEVWFGGKTIMNPDHVNLGSDAHGNLRQAIVREGNRIELTMMNNPGEPFHLASKMNLLDAPDKAWPLSITAKENGIATMTWTQEGRAFDVDAIGIDKLIIMLSSIRNLIEPKPETRPVNGECPIDPQWRTLTRPHPSIPGPAVHFLHPVFGWIGFVLPDHEAKALGEWLIKDVAHRELKKD